LNVEALIKIEVSSDLFLLVHEESGEDLVGIGSCNVIVAALINAIDEIHRFLGVAIEHNPFLEVHVLILHLFDER
jgi:hypothetical protein